MKLTTLKILLIVFCVGSVVHARIDHDEKDHKVQDSRFKSLVDAMNFYNNNLIGVSQEKRDAAFLKLRRFAAQYPELKAFSQKLEKMKSKDPMRIEIKLAENTVKFSVFWRDTGKEVYSVNTTPAMADYYKQGLKDSGRCDVGCAIIPITPGGGSR